MRRVLPLIAVLSLSFAPAPFPKPAKPESSKEDLKKMQGTWTRVSVTIQGQKVEERPGTIAIVITGTHLQFPDPLDGWTITVDAKKRPKVFDCLMDRPE